MTEQTNKLLDILQRVTEAAIDAGGMTITVRFGDADPLHGDVEQLAADVGSLQTMVTENDRAASAAISSIERTQEVDQALLGAQEKRLTEAEDGLACGHDCGTWSCPTLRADWKREGFSCGNGGCPRREP